MADAQKTIDLIFNGVDKTGAATQAALNNLSSFSTSVGNIAAPIADFTIAAAKLEAAILASGVAVTAFAVKVAGDFEGAFAQLSTLFDASSADMELYKQNVRDYAAQSSKSMEDVMASLQAAVGSGVDYKDSLALITAAEKLSIATKSDMKAATEVLVSTMNSYGMSSKDAAEMADLLFQIIKDGKIEMDDLSRSLAQVTPLAAAAGVGMKEVGAAIAVLTASGMQPSTAIEALRSALSNIIKPSEQAKKEAESLGIEFNASALKAKGLSGVLDDVAKATGGSTEKMALLFGDVTGLTAALALTGPQAEKFKTAIESMGSSAGSVTGAYDKMAGSMENVIQRLTNSFLDLMVAIGTPLLNEFGGIATAITQMFSTLSDSVRNGALKSLSDYIEGQFRNLQATMEKVAKNLPAALAGADFSGFTKGIDAVIKAVEFLFGGIDLTSAEGLKKLIETTGLAFLGLSNYVAGTIEGFKPLLDLVVSMAGAADEGNTAWLKWAGGMGTWAIEAAKVAPIFTAIFAGLAAAPTIATSIGAVTTALGGMAAILAGGVLAPMAGIAGWGLGTAINDGVLTPLLSLATGSKTTLGGFLYDLLHAGDGATEFGNKAKEAFRKSELSAKDAAPVINAAGESMQASFRKSEIALQGASDVMDKTTDATKTLGAAQKDSGKYVIETVPIYDKLTGAITGYEQQLVKAESATNKFGASASAINAPVSKTAAEIAKAEEVTRKWNEEIAKMAFQEKLKLIDSATKISVANIEAFSKDSVAAFASIDVGIKSTGDLIGSLFGDLKGASRWDQLEIEAQIKKENDRRDQEFKLQKEKIEAQIKMMNAQVDAMNSSDGMIKIDGAGLQPHLEAFMWEILRTIQVKVNSDGLKLLMGI